jgi:hypothetical protein
MRVYSTAFWLQKPSLKPEEFEDAYYPRASGERAGEQLRFAVADGATEGVGSAAWAQILVEAYGRTKAPAIDLPRFLKRGYIRWSKHKERYLRGQAASGGVPWFVEEGLRIGAFSTLLGLCLIDAEGEAEGEWEAFAVGDSCLAQVRTDALVRMFPIEEAEGFGNSPVLIGSNPAYNQTVPPAVKTCRGRWRTDDCMYLMTDALAEWFAREYEQQRLPWRLLRDLDTEAQVQPFEELVRGLQASAEMRKDDVTLVRIDVL